MLSLLAFQRQATRGKTWPVWSAHCWARRRGTSAACSGQSTIIPGEDLESPELSPACLSILADQPTSAASSVPSPSSHKKERMQAGREKAGLGVRRGLVSDSAALQTPFRHIYYDCATTVRHFPFVRRTIHTLHERLSQSRSVLALHLPLLSQHHAYLELCKD